MMQSVIFRVTLGTTWRTSQFLCTCSSEETASGIKTLKDCLASTINSAAQHAVVVTRAIATSLARKGDDVSASIMAGIIRAIKVACSDAIIRAQRPNRFKKACASYTLSITERVLQV